ncbi:MAG: heat-inducible transcriptional repressor HrcA [Solirubrobacterales bacterium]
MLDERKKSILEAIIREYVKSAEPVGSRAIVRKHGLGVSAATVRNEMADLEEMGFLEQPHTSAGRIPSERGFRYYVDFMMEKERLSSDEERFLGGIFGDKVGDISSVVQKTGQALAQLTNCASVVLTHPAEQPEFRHLQLVYLGAGKALAVLVTDMGNVTHKRMDIPESIGPEDLDAVSQIFNASLQGRHLGDLNRTVLEAMRRELANRRELLDGALEAIDFVLSEEEEERVYVGGALNILNQPEFKDYEKLKRVLVMLDEHDFLKGLLNETGMKEVRIKIGHENQQSQIKELSIVFTSAEVQGREVGRIGLIGPVRMEYWRALASVEKVREAFENAMASILR